MMTREQPTAPTSRTVFILTSEAPESGGGMEHFVREAIRGLELRGYRTRVFHRGNSEPGWLTRKRGPIGRKIAGTLLGFWIGRRAQRYMTEDVAAVISNSTVGYFPLRCKASFKNIHFHHGTYRGQSEAIRPFISYGGYLYLKWWDSMMLERSSGRGKLALTCSEQTSDEVSRFFGQKSTAAWYPIDTERFQPLDAKATRAALNLPTGKSIGVFVGSVHPMKGFSVVRSLIEHFPEVHWILALRGELRRDKVVAPNVTILQNVPHDRIPTLYSAADLSVCPSLYEPFGYVVAEALACGTPVIASPGGASRLFLRGDPMSRLLITNGDPVQGFANAVREVLRDPGLYRRSVMEGVRPKIEELMAPENWWRRFFELTGL
jgi:glycosyltransferase involved in cell wall biosynthesis